MMVLAALALASCGEADRAPAPQPVAVQGERLTVARGDIAEFKPLAAEIATRDQAEALVRIPGTLVELTVREGDEVRKGQAIGRVVDTRISYETSALSAQVNAASAQADQARAELGRAQYLYGKGFVAKARLEQAQAAARTANAQVAATRAQVSASTESSRQGVILAPATGRVLRADIPKGSVVAPGMSVATVTSGPPVLRIDVPQSLAGQLGVGAQFVIRDQAGLPDTTGKITQIYPAETGGRVRAEAEMTQLPTNFIGRRVSVLLGTGARAGIVVPRRFVSTRFGIDYVDVATKDGAMSTVVQTAPGGNPAVVEILSGVVAGDVLVAGKPAQ